MTLITNPHAYPRDPRNGRSLSSVHLEEAVTTSDPAPCQTTGKLRAAIAGHGARHMFRHEPAVLLCPPLHTAIRGNSGGRARFTFDEPSDQLASFANAAITAVEAELGQETDALLSLLGAELPATLVSPRA